MRIFVILLATTFANICLYGLLTLVFSHNKRKNNYIFSLKVVIQLIICCYSKRKIND